MAALYGRTFTSQFGETPDNTWIRCLQGVTGQQIAQALERCLEKHPEWPPGAAQFRSLCTGTSKTLAEAQQGVIAAADREHAAEKQRERLRLKDTNRKARTQAKGESTMANLYSKLGWNRGEDDEVGENTTQDASQEAGKVA